ncbi:MAG: carboxypeptidase-like regulatory domain-containing protein [Catalinimonas sp.]
MSYRLFLPLIFTTVMLAGDLHAQMWTEQGGRVRDATTLAPVPGAHVLNLTHRRGTATDTTGAFRLPARPADTLVVTALGYTSDTLAVPEGVDEWEIDLQPTVYELESMVFERGDVARFKRDLLALDLPPEEEEGIKIAGVRRHIDPGAAERGRPTLLSPASFLYDRLSKRAKEERKVAQLEREANFQRQIRKKFNERIVGDITGLEGEALTDFMNYCRPADEFLAQANAYEIHAEVLTCLRRYEAR